MLILFLLLTFLMFVVMVKDVSTYRIPNVLVLILLCFYPVVVVLARTHIDWQMASVVCLCTFIIGYIILFRFMGGGDVKLLTAATLYTGVPALPDYITYVAIIGGLGTLVLLGLRAMAPWVFMKLGNKTIPRVLTHKEPVPYGVAIALGFLIELWGDKLPGLTL